MMTKEQMKQLWEHIKALHPEELEASCEEFEFDSARMADVDMFTEDDIESIWFDLMYMLVEGVYDGRFDMMYETLIEVLGFPDTLVNELLAW